MSDDILFQQLPGRDGDLGLITLDRPRALHALTYEMCFSLREQLEKWQTNSKIKAVVLRSTPGRAFCAGGDVKALYEHRDDAARLLRFFDCEYQLNKTVYHFTKPYISFLDGITMGGGAGISIHGSHRVATEQFSFAMPETCIGFFPDVGAAHFLNQCPGYFGHYLGLTGYTVTQADAYALSLVNHCVARNRLDPLLHTLCESPFESQDFKVVSQIINRFESAVAEPPMWRESLVINQCFKHPSIEQLFESLSEADTPFTRAVAQDLLARSPLSLKVTLAHLNQAKALDFDALMQMNFNLAHHFLEGDDFFEGVRAVLVDKDNKPRWHPRTVHEVQEETVAKFFIQEYALGSQAKF